MAIQQALDVFDASLLKNLQPSSHLELLDVIDKLRALGLNEHVDLPQLIVCGDQSSGKSSVLAAISGVPFPKKDNLCTRFATEVVLRRDYGIANNQISVSITPSSTRLPIDRQTLASFARELSSIDDLESTINDATTAMGLDAIGSAFSADILRLDVRGPEMPQLTIVDLPGLVHSENKFQSAEDIVLVNKLIEEYMSQQRSIILAIVSAKNDYANQIVLTKARNADPFGQRTLGIITKPDALHPGSSGESSFLYLASNQDIKFSLGWHIVRNLDSNKHEECDRDALEASFFEGSAFKSISPRSRGIHTLQERLSEVLFQHIRRELPGMVSEIMRATDETRTHLSRMGRSRVTPMEKRIFVMELGEKFAALCFAACEGLYEDPFFEDSGSVVTRRLRAVVQNANIDFATQMLKTPLQLPNVVRRKNSDKTTPITLQRAQELINSYRGKELPGTFNPALIGQLFRELSHFWSSRAREHISNVWLYARTTVIEILHTIAEDYVQDACVKNVVDPELAIMQREMENRLHEYMLEFHRQPITYNHYLTETVQAAQHKRNYAIACDACRKLFESRDRLTSQDVHLIATSVVPRVEADMDAIAAQDLADYAEAYYKVALKRVMDEIPAHVIEPAILIRLPKILESSQIMKMPEAQIEDIGGEPDARKKLRESLQTKLDVFNRSALICKIYSDQTVLNDSNIDELEQDISVKSKLHRLNSSEQGKSNIVQEQMNGFEEDEVVEAFGTPDTDLSAVATVDDDWGALKNPRKSKKIARAKKIFEDGLD